MATYVYFLPVGIQKKRLEIMQKGVEKIGLKLAIHYRYEVNFIVSELESYELVIDALKLGKRMQEMKAKIISSKWFFDSLKAGCLLPSSSYEFKKISDTNIQENYERKSYLCFRPTLLCHKNQRFVSALEKLADAAELKLGEKESSRALAFRKAAGELKQLPYELCHTDELDQFECVGKHSKAIIREILEDSCCQEVLQLEVSEWFASVKLFCNVYGIGPVTANAWYDVGLRTLDDIKYNSFLNFDQRVIYGLSFYQDLSTPVTKLEAEIISNIVSTEVESILPGTLLYLVGGFYRGKETGHDVDILISPPLAGKERWLLDKLCHKLKLKNLLLHQVADYKRTSFRKGQSFDNFDKSFTIFRLPNNTHAIQDHSEIFGSAKNESIAALIQLAESKRDWCARRVDLIVCPLNELPFALLGWTGSKLFNRSLRNYAKKELNLRLTSHSLYDITSNTYVSISSEKEIFDKLKVCYLNPAERNL